MDPRESGGRSAATQRLLPLTLTAIGVVYGDIGTSPLYTIASLGHGRVAPEGSRGDGPERRARHGLLPPSAERVVELGVQVEM